MSHAIFGGAVASYVIKVNFYAGAGVWGFLSALMVNRVARRRTIGADAAIGVVTTASFAIGLALISRYRGFTRNFDAALFGNILGVTATDVWVVAAVTVFAAAVVFFFYRKLLFTTFDPEVADASGVNTSRIDTLFSFTLAAAIVATMNVLGVTLVAAALVVPAVIARLLTNSFSRMLWYAVAIGGVAGFFGMYMSWFWNISSGASIVLTEAALFLVVYTISGVRGRLRPLPSVEARDLV
jgi:manganese/iron transport system permease protein/iron/zinc/copper transport system permease protein